MSETLKEIVIQSRLIQRHDIEENWNKATDFAPRLGEMIIYDPDSTHRRPRYKLGIWDGVSEKTADMLCVNLPFANQPDIISEEDLESLFISKTTKTVANYASFNFHLVDTSDHSLHVITFIYIPGITTWGDLVENYPDFFTATSTEWDKNTGKPYVRFTNPYYGGDYVIKRVAAINPEDPVSVPCIVTDFVDPSVLRVTYVCHDSTTCAICASYHK